MRTLGIILARAGSKGLPGKCMRPLRGRPLIAYTLDHARASTRLTACLLSTDSEPAKAYARALGVEVIDRPAELATDTATVDDAARHAVLEWEARHGGLVDAVTLLYANIPLRAAGLIDRALEHLERSGADSVRSVAPVSKQHPDWIHRLDGDRMAQFRPNSIYRRQDLEPLYYHDGAVAAVTRTALFAALETPDDHQAFLGKDRRAIVQAPEDAVDVDTALDLHLADALLSATRSAPASAPTVAVAGRSVGPTSPLLVIAEAGVNHNGDRATALALIDAAAEAGADAVKFQLFRADQLTTDDAPSAAYQKGAGGPQRQRDLLARLELSRADFERLRQRCAERGLLFVLTPFSVPMVELAVELGAAALKIASTDLVHDALLDAAAAAGLPVIASTGAATAEEITQQVHSLQARGLAGRLVLLHCVSCYPTPGDAAQLGAIRALADAFALPVGYSDHTANVETGGWAVAAGACVLEKHFTLDRAAAGPDHAFSLEPDQLAAYIAAARSAQAALGQPAFGMQEREADVRTAARQSIVAAQAIAAGTTLTAELLTCKRPGTGLPPTALPRLLGRVTAVDIAADTLLSEDQLG